MQDHSSRPGIPDPSGSPGLPSWITYSMAVMSLLGALKVFEVVKWAWDRREKKKEAEKQAQAAEDKVVREALDDWYRAANILMDLHRDMWSCLSHHAKDVDDGFYWEGESYGDMWFNLNGRTEMYKSARIKLLTLKPKPDLARRVSEVHEVFLSTKPISPGTMGEINYSSATGPNIAAMDELEEVLEDITIKGNK